MSVQLNAGKLDATMAELGTIDKIPQDILMAAGSITSVNLSFNALEDAALPPLKQFNAVETLVLDNNDLTSLKDFPELNHLHTLWLNKNQIQSIDETLTVLQRCAPRLTYLSLVMNPCAPSELTGASEAEYSRYRVLVKYRLPKLQLLDAAPFTAKETETAKERGKFYTTATAKQEQPTNGSPTSANPPTTSSSSAKDSKKEKNAPEADTDQAVDNNKKKGQQKEEDDSSDDEDLFAKVAEEREQTNAHGAFYSKQQHYYSGKTSEGNRFIKDSAL